MSKVIPQALSSLLEPHTFSDAAGNIAACSFEVVVNSEYCCIGIGLTNTIELNSEQSFFFLWSMNCDLRMNKFILYWKTGMITFREFPDFRKFVCHSVDIQDVLRFLDFQEMS